MEDLKLLVPAKKTAEKFPILFPNGLTADEFAKNLKLYNIPTADNTSLLALALIQQSKQNLIKNIQLFENSPQTFDPFLIRKIFNSAAAMRSKRNVFSDALAGFLGLATSNSVSNNKFDLDIIKQNEQSFLTAYKNMTERSKLYNSMFQNLQNSLTSLSHYETDTNQHITDEHANIIKLANETDDLVRYTKLLEPIMQKSIILLNNIDTYNSIYAEIEENIKSIVFNKLLLSLIIDQPEDINNIDNKNIKSTVKLTTKGFKINFDAPKNNNKFYIFTLKSLPFPLKHRFFYYNLNNIIGISNSKMYIMEEDIKTDCTLGPDCTCKPTITTRYGTTCEKEIVLQDFSKNTTNLCENKLDVATQLHQQIIINHNVATIFTPRTDQAKILCNHKPAETSTLNVGINFIQHYANCTIATSEFVQKKSQPKPNFRHSPN